MNNPYQQKIQATQYLEQKIQNASPVEQIVMLYDGSIKFILKAKQAIDEGDIEARCNANQRAIKIVSYLMGILSDEKGGEITPLLYRVYSHVIALLVQIDIQNSHEPADQAIGHLKELRASWVQLANPQTPIQEGETPEGKPQQIQTRSAIA